MAERGGRVERLVLSVYARLPRPVRIRLVRLLKPSYVVGTIPFVFREDGRLLLVRHSYKSGWATPGGFVDRGEPPADAAIREVGEEVGLVVRIVGEPTVVVDPRERRVEVALRVVPVDDADANDAVPVSPEIVEARWFDPAALPELQRETIAARDAAGRAGWF